jgi:hypothetical protein
MSGMALYGGDSVKGKSDLSDEVMDRSTGQDPVELEAPAEGKAAASDKPSHRSAVESETDCRAAIQQARVSLVRTMLQDIGFSEDKLRRSSIRRHQNRSFSS